MASRYQILVAGSLTPSAEEMLAGFDVSTEGERTLISGVFDQAALHGLLERVRALGLELVELRRVDPRTRRA